MPARKWTIKGDRNKPYLEAEGPALLAGSSVTAYDARDVEPLLLAARALDAERVQSGISKRLPDNIATRELLENLAHALAPFDSEEKT